METPEPPPKRPGDRLKHPQKWRAALPQPCNHIDSTHLNPCRAHHLSSAHLVPPPPPHSRFPQAELFDTGLQKEAFVPQGLLVELHGRISQFAPRHSMLHCPINKGSETGLRDASYAHRHQHAHAPCLSHGLALRPLNQFHLMTNPWSARSTEEWLCL